MTKEEREAQRTDALQKLGKWVSFAHMPDGRPYWCSLMDPDGMVELLGLSGRFAPHLLVVVVEDRVRHFLDAMHEARTAPGRNGDADRDQ